MFIDKNTTAALDIDAQCGFTFHCPDELPVPFGEEIVPACLENHTKARYKIMSKDAHPHWGRWNVDQLPTLTPIGGKDVDVAWPRHCVIGTPGFELLAGLPHPREYNFFIYKGAEYDMHPYSPIYQDLAKTISTGIIEWAKCHGVNTFILGGLALNFCLGEGARDLKAAGFRVIVNLAATRGLGDCTAYIAELKALGIEVVDRADEIVNEPDVAA